MGLMLVNRLVGEMTGHLDCKSYHKCIVKKCPGDVMVSSNSNKKIDMIFESLGFFKDLSRGLNKTCQD